MASADLGYGPGPRHALALAEPDDYLSRLRTNGVTVTTGRTAFHPVQGELGPVVCPRCDQTMLLEDAGTGATTKQWEAFSDAIDSWHNGGPGDMACASCGQISLLPPYEGTWSARRGSYRVLYEIGEENRILIVTAVEYRSDAYRSR
ncbi:hypothetical protein [Frankia sp. Cr2]|uniref:type II toxin-antitoxin system RelE family toxin n=1 Tax=Frankia sp. Cr2 TaxID=3073932 RepID=UPI002AD40723|nr:hypothetical protein [Frankia sp. Cr2]